MNQKVLDRLKRIRYAPMKAEELTQSSLANLKERKGVVIETNTTDLWINRGLSVHDVIGQPVLMESVNEFMITDSFGLLLWSGTPDAVIEYAQGFCGVEGLK